MSMDFIDHSLLLALPGQSLEHFTLAFVLFPRQPPFLLESNVALEVGLIQYPYLHGSANVQIRRANNQVVNTEDWRLNLIPLVEVLQIDVGSKLLIEVHALPVELCVCLLVVPV